MGANGEYRWSPEHLKSMSASVKTMALEMANEENPGESVAQKLGWTQSDEELATLDSVSNQDDKTRCRAVKTTKETKTNTGWTTVGHTGVEVEVNAFGAG